MTVYLTTAIYTLSWTDSFFTYTGMGRAGNGVWLLG